MVMEAIQARALNALMGYPERADDWTNDVLNMGGSKDPSAFTTYGRRPPLTDETLEALFIEEHFAARLVEALPKAAMRHGWDLVLAGDPRENAKTRDAYAMKEDELGIAREMLRASTFGRLFGGALIWIGAEDAGQPSAPLREDAIQTIRFLHTFDRRDVLVETYYQDPEHPKFAQPETYRVRPIIAANVAAAFGAQAGGVVLHETRCVAWGGQPTTDRRKLERNGWDDSVLERAWVPLRQVGEDFAGKSLLLARVSQMVYKIQDLYGKLAMKTSAEMITRRMALLDSSRSRSRAVLLDTTEDAVQITQPVAGIDSLIDKSVARAASSGNMSASILMDQGADNATVASADQDNWDQEIADYQEATLRPRHERIASLILLAKDGPTAGTEPVGYVIKYRPLRTLKPKEAAEVAKLRADTDAVNIDKGVYTADDAALAGFTSIGEGRVRLDTKAVERRVQRRNEAADQPPKDNAELGTVGARAGGGQRDILKDVNQGFISRRQGKAILMLTFRLTDQEAEEMLGEEGFVPSPQPSAKPGPAPDPAKGTGAGAPQGLSGFNAGGDPKDTTKP